MYQVGKLEYPEKNDSEFGRYGDAIKFATDKSYDDSVYAIWRGQKEGSDLVAIVYQQEVFEK